jgi:hypothetical protein
MKRPTPDYHRRYELVPLLIPTGIVLALIVIASLVLLLRLGG